MVACDGRVSRGSSRAPARFQPVRHGDARAWRD